MTSKSNSKFSSPRSRVPRAMAALCVASAVTVAAQVAPLGNDAWHRVVFENPQMRILSVNVDAGATTQEHRHDFDMVTVSMNDGTETRLQTGSQPATARPPRPLGDVVATEYTGKPSSHRIENIGKRPYQLFAVENRKKSGWSTGAAASGIATKVMQESRAFRIYDVQLSLKASQATHTHTAPTVVVLVRGKVMSDGPDKQAKAFAPAPVGLRQLDQTGQWLVVPQGDQHHLVRLGTVDAQVVEIELR